MIKDGLNRIKPDRRDFSLVHTFGATVADTQSLPSSFSIYDGRPIPNQDDVDTRFNPQLPALPFGCTGETGAFETGLQDGTLCNPQDLYLATPPYNQGGRDIRDMLKVLINRGVVRADGTMSEKRLAYFNCYGTGGIDDFNAARIGIWINQAERRGVYLGTWWYPEFENAGADGILPLPSFNINEASLHNHLATGFYSTYKDDYIETISWQGMHYAKNGLAYVSRADYNALMAQPYTGAFTITKMPSNTPVPVGVQAEIDHLVYFIRNLFNV